MALTSSHKAHLLTVCADLCPIVVHKQPQVTIKNLGSTSSVTQVTSVWQQTECNISCSRKFPSAIKLSTAHVRVEKRHSVVLKPAEKPGNERWCGGGGMVSLQMERFSSCWSCQSKSVVVDAKWEKICVEPCNASFIYCSSIFLRCVYMDSCVCIQVIKTQRKKNTLSEVSEHVLVEAASQNELAFGQRHSNWLWICFFFGWLNVQYKLRKSGGKATWEGDTIVFWAPVWEALQIKKPFIVSGEGVTRQKSSAKVAAWQLQ